MIAQKRGAAMCNLYSVTTNVEAIRAFVRDMHVDEMVIGNMPPQTGVFPDYLAPIVRNFMDQRELTKVRWGHALSEGEFKRLVEMEPDSGTTNVRNVNSKHWQRWLTPEFRCVVPFTSFSEFNRDEGGDIWFAFEDSRPLAFFAGIWAPQWKSVRKIKEGMVTTDLFAFLTTEPNAEMKPIHPKAMPVILRTPEEVEIWMTAPWEIAKDLQRPLPDGALKIVSRGAKEDPPPPPMAPAEPDLF
jgi:putative SOS response-associated peptidase YedK